jgi:hypothetical protein
VNINRLILNRNLRTSVFVLVFGFVAAWCGLIFYWNYTGLPTSWRAAIERELAKQGIEAKIKKLRYVPLRGVEATEVEIFSDAERTQRVAFLERLVFDFDKSKAMRGITHLTHIDLHNAELRLPVDPQEPEREAIQVKNLNGTVLLSRSRKFEIKRGTGLIDGIQLKIDAVIYGFRQVPGYESKDEESGMHRKFLREFVKEVNQWQLDPDNPPELSLKVEADATKWHALKCEFVFACEKASRGEISLRDVSATGNVTQSLVVVNTLRAEDQRGHVSATMDYDLAAQVGNFEIDSTLDAVLWYESIVKKKLPNRMTHSGEMRVQSRGRFERKQKGEPWLWQLRGSCGMKNVLIDGQAIRSLESEFSLRQGDFYLRHCKIEHEEGQCVGNLMRKNGQWRAMLRGPLPMRMLRPYYREGRFIAAVRALEVDGLPKVSGEIDMAYDEAEGVGLQRLTINNLAIEHPQGQLRGWVHIAGPEVTYGLESNARAETWKMFFPEQVLERVLANFSSNSQSEYAVKLTGKTHRIDRQAWSVKGVGEVKNVSYRGVPVLRCRTDLDLRHQHLRFSAVEVDFDYRNYRLHQTYGGAANGLVKAKEVVYDHALGVVTIDALKGSIYPSPLLRLFAPSIADTLEEYEFHTPPTLSARGKVDVRAEGKTSLTVQVQQAPAMNWVFLGSPVTIRSITGDVSIDDQKVTLTQLKGMAFGGEVAGTVNVSLQEGRAFSTQINWDNMMLESISETYQFKEKGYGYLTGRIDLKGKSGDTKTLQGEGQCTLEKGELFAVPLFGPLSKLVAFVLADRRVGFERAKDAYCHFNIRDGIMRTNDFVTYTSSLKFTGNGAVNLNDSTIDMTMRMNARGLLGLVVMPFQPIIKGLFQFKGQGAMDDPKWEHVIFTSPPAVEEEALFKTSPKPGP